jgi:hypothetical protein
MTKIRHLIRYCARHGPSTLPATGSYLHVLRENINLKSNSSSLKAIITQQSRRYVTKQFNTNGAKEYITRFYNLNFNN